MPQCTLTVKLKCQPGKRDAVKSLWEGVVKPHAESNSNVQFSCYTFDQNDPDVIVLFEVLADDSVLTGLYREAWFREYVATLGTFLAGPPEIVTGTPVWIKGV